MPFPWPRRHVRRAAVTSAQRERARSQAAAAHAASIERDIQRMRAENHFAFIIAQDIIRRHEREG